MWGIICWDREIKLTTSDSGNSIKKLYLWHLVQGFCLKKTSSQFILRRHQRASQSMWFLRTVGIRISRCKVPSQTPRKNVHTHRQGQLHPEPPCLLAAGPSSGGCPLVPSHAEQGSMLAFSQVKSLLWSAP